MPVYRAIAENDLDIYVTKQGFIVFNGECVKHGRDAIILMSVRQAKELLDDLPYLIEDAAQQSRFYLEGKQDAQ